VADCSQLKKTQNNVWFLSNPSKFHRNEKKIFKMGRTGNNSQLTRVPCLAIEGGYKPFLPDNKFQRLGDETVALLAAPLRGARKL